MKKMFTKNDYFNPKTDVIWTDNRSDVNESEGLHSMEKYLVCAMIAVDATCCVLTRLRFFPKG